MYNNIKGIKQIGHSLGRILPESAFRFVLKAYHIVLSIFETPMSWYAIWRVNRSIGKIAKSGSPVRFCFYVVLPSMFQWRRVFELMQKDERFSPFIVVTPRIGWQIGDMEATVEKTYKSLVNDYGEEYVFQGYHDGIFENHMEECDACTMMNLYSGLAERRFEAFYLATHGIPVYGSCYAYNIGTKHTPEYYSMRSLKFVRRFFCSNQVEFGEFTKYQRIQQGSDRVRLSGCAKTDAITFEGQKKISNRKRILIAPHHSVLPTVDSGLCHGNFLSYKDLFLELPKKYPDIDWIFRPHPHLKLNLVKNVGWTEGEWDDYIKNYLSSPNAIFEDDGPYYKSFAVSDGMIHDCGSFLPEYFYTGKPQCFVLASEDAKCAQFDSWGLSIIEHTYPAYSKDDIIRFIEEVVIKGRDPMKEERQKFAREKIMVNYPHASEYIVESIAEMLGRGKEGGITEKK